MEVVACTLCGSDLHTVHGRRTVPVPTILGHEILGRIVGFGSGRAADTTRREAAAASAIASPGASSRAAAIAIIAAATCPRSARWQIKYGHEPLRPGGELTGGLAGHCLLVAGTAMFRVPDDLADATACPANCATATVAAALEAAGPLEGRSRAGHGVRGCSA